MTTHYDELFPLPAHFGSRDHGSYCVTGTEFQFGHMTEVLERDVGDGCTQYRGANATDAYP